MERLTCFGLQQWILVADTTVAVNTSVSLVTAQTIMVLATAASAAMVMTYILTFKHVKVSLPWLYKIKNSDVQPQHDMVYVFWLKKKKKTSISLPMTLVNMLVIMSFLSF